MEEKKINKLTIDQLDTVAGGQPSPDATPITVIANVDFIAADGPGEVGEYVMDKTLTGVQNISAGTRIQVFMESLCKGYVYSNNQMNDWGGSYRYFWVRLDRVTIAG